MRFTVKESKRERDGEVGRKFFFLSYLTTPKILSEGLNRFKIKHIQTNQLTHAHTDVVATII